MEKAEARRIAEKDIKEYRTMSYEDIAEKIGRAEHYQRVDGSSEAYQVEFDFF